MRSAVRNGLRRSSRLSCVVLHWEEFVELEAGFARRAQYDVQLNAGAQHLPDALRSLVNGSGQHEWRQLKDIFPELTTAYEHRA
jgi:hypothetical protein